MVDETILIDADTLQLGDRLTIKRGHEISGLVYGDELIVSKIERSGSCRVHVRSVEGKGSEASLRSSGGSGFGFYTWRYDYFLKGICMNCISRCKENGKEECDFFEGK